MSVYICEEYAQEWGFEWEHGSRKCIVCHLLNRNKALRDRIEGLEGEIDNLYTEIQNA